jgi:hypothetical protein
MTFSPELEFWKGKPDLDQARCMTTSQTAGDRADVCIQSQLPHAGALRPIREGHTPVCCLRTFQGSPEPEFPDNPTGAVAVELAAGSNGWLGPAWGYPQGAAWCDVFTAFRRDSARIQPCVMSRR